MWFAKSCQTLLRPHGLYSLLVSSVHGISQARILEWVAIFFSRGSSQLGDQTQISCTGSQILYHQATREAYFEKKKKNNELSETPFFSAHIQSINIQTCSSISLLKNLLPFVHDSLLLPFTAQLLKSSPLRLPSSCLSCSSSGFHLRCSPETVLVTSLMTSTLPSQESLL